MDLEELREEVSYLVNFNPTQADQSFAGTATQPYKRIDSAINEAYQKEVNHARRMIRRQAFWTQHAFTWPSSTQTVDIPAEVAGKDIMGLRDDTNENPGYWLQFTEPTTSMGGLYVEDKDRWSWFPAPSEDRTITVFYLASAEKLIDEGDVPSLLTSDDHWVIVWRAAMLLRIRADEQVSNDWKAEYKSTRDEFHKGVASGKPYLLPPPAIRHSRVDRGNF
jgi:hypothetical protein